jgi:PAS domain S-box-containing protein
MLGQSIFRLACVDGEKDMIAVLHQICRGERVDHYETMRRRKDGTEIAVSLTVSPMRARPFFAPALMRETGHIGAEHGEGQEA